MVIYLKILAEHYCTITQSDSTYPPRAEGPDGNIHGFIQILSGEVGIVLRPQTNGAHYKVSADNGCEVGAGWKRTSKDGKAYVSVRLDSPFLWAPINCAMFGNKDAPIVSCDSAVKPDRPRGGRRESPLFFSERRVDACPDWPVWGQRREPAKTLSGSKHLLPQFWLEFTLTTPSAQAGDSGDSGDSVLPLKPEHWYPFGEALQPPLAEGHEPGCILPAQLAH
jgi:uncharacterized protein (DUF736 family)